MINTNTNSDNTPTLVDQSTINIIMNLTNTQAQTAITEADTNQKHELAGQIIRFVKGANQYEEHRKIASSYLTNFDSAYLERFYKKLDKATITKHSTSPDILTFIGTKYSNLFLLLGFIYANYKINDPAEQLVEKYKGYLNSLSYALTECQKAA